jgi:hypothetical protein
MNYDQWITDFLNALQAPVTPQNVAFMNAWIAKESGHYPISYGWNPLNTTQSAPGSYGGGAQGNIQFFPDYQSGLNANVQTIKNGYYPDLLAVLRSGNPTIGAPYHGLSIWGSGSLAGLQGAKPTSSGSAPTSSTSSGSPTSSTSSGSSTSSSGAWSQNFKNLPFGLGPAAEDVVSAGLVGVFALALLLIGGIWLIMGNASTRTIAVNTTKAAAKTAAIAA